MAGDQRTLNGVVKGASGPSTTTVGKGRKRAAPTDASPATKKRKSAPASPDQASRGKKNAKGDLGDKAKAEELAEEGPTPLAELEAETAAHGKRLKDGSFKRRDGGTVVYWMRMKDLRIKDNRALALASQVAQEEGKHLVVLHVMSPGDYKAHDRAAVRIDFVLRNLQLLRDDFAKLDIPLHVMTVEPRKTIPERVVGFCDEVGASSLYASIEYEVDELRQATKTIQLGEKVGLDANFCRDLCIVEPGKVLTKQGKPYSVYSPWLKNWASVVSGDPLTYVDDAGEPSANDKAVRKDKKLASLFDCQIPDSVPGFEVPGEKLQHIRQAWPAGTEAAEARLKHFIENKARSTKTEFDSLEEGEHVGPGKKGSRIAEYATGRNHPDVFGTSRLSPYLAAGVISLRACVRAAMALNKNKLDVERSNGIGMWTQELAWKDFYQHVLAAWPRVCMRKPFVLKFENVVWEEDEEKLQAWKDGRTGYPIVDAAMRQISQQGYVHNRCRMIVAMFLTKDLMMDWKLGEQYFMQNLIDGDFGSNNGGWQWSASTGCDPQPYFRIFSPLSQSEKSDTTGDYIRHYVPELAKVKGNAIHEPHTRLSKAEFEKLGYPKPIVDHKVARKRALARYKNPGCADDE